MVKWQSSILPLREAPGVQVREEPAGLDEAREVRTERALLRPPLERRIAGVVEVRRCCALVSQRNGKGASVV